MVTLLAVLGAHHKKRMKLTDIVQHQYRVLVRARVVTINKEILCLKQVNRG
jgi:hypothetical protein